MTAAPGGAQPHTAADSGARRAGIRQHDVLMALDGEAVVYEEQLVDAVAALRDGQQVQARLLRGDQVIEVPATASTSCSS